VLLGGDDMSIIVCQISKYGIVSGSDSFVGSDAGKVESRRKVLQVLSPRASVAVAGTYTIGGLDFDKWFDQVVKEETRDTLSPSLSGFVNRLALRLRESLHQNEIDIGSLIHVAGYVLDSGAYHPEFWFIRNRSSINRVSGEYEGSTDVKVSEDFWSNNRDRWNAQSVQGTCQIYANGVAPGRIVIMELQQEIAGFLRELWANPDWGLNPPDSVEDMAELVRLYLNVVCSLFRIHDPAEPSIGGEPQIDIITCPSYVGLRGEADRAMGNAGQSPII
jgi:hypothetical protein